MAAKDQGAYVRDSTGNTTTSRIHTVDVTMGWADSNNTWDTTAATNLSSGVSFTGSTNATDTLDSVADGVFEFTYDGTTYDLDGVDNTQLMTSSGAALTTSSTLADLADAITATVSNMTASVVNNGSTNFLVMDGAKASSPISGITTTLALDNAGTNTATIATYSAGFL